MKQEKRHKLQLYRDILSAVEEDSIGSGAALPMHIQHHSRLSYDKMTRHFDELEEIGMIRREAKGLLTITDKGRQFVRQYDELVLLIESAGL